ncbi:MAG: hypothetical protein M3N57_08785 [Actinomycetota bacterium]|nr:hypothetical protein [Actinomycetota bacterium]
MRTTVEISDDQRRALAAIAHRRGLRGFSVLVQEALDTYLRDQDAGEVELMLSLEGSVDDEEEAEIRGRIDEARSLWRSAS